jgi:hypothetical protein
MSKPFSTMFGSLPLILRSRIRVCLARIFLLALRITFFVAGFFGGGTFPCPLGLRGKAGHAAGFEGVHLAC